MIFRRSCMMASELAFDTLFLGLASGLVLEITDSNRELIETPHLSAVTRPNGRRGA